MKQNLNIIIILIIASFSLSIGGHLTITQSGVNESAGSEKRLFTVTDAVSRLELVEPARSSDFKFSPDKSHFITITRQGNLKSGFNDFKLLLYNTDIVIDYINNEEKKIANLSTLLLLFSSSSNWKDAFSDIRWMPDNETLVFIGETSEKPIAQIYTLNIFSKKLHQLTDHPKAIVSYNINDAGDIIFTAGVPVPDETYGKTSYVVGIMSMDRRQMKICNPKDIYENNEHPVLSQAFFLQHGDSGQAVPIGQPFSGSSFGLALSNNGRWAIDTRWNSQIPREWMEGYFPLQNKGWLQHNNKNFDPNTMRETTANGTRFVLLDISSKTERQLFDAPTGYDFGGYGSDVKIMKDNKSIILGNTFLPLNTSDSKERERRRNSTFTVDYNIETKEILIIAEHVIQPGKSFADEPYSGITLQSDGTLNLSQGREEQSLKKFRKQNGKWRVLEKLDKSNYLNLDKISKTNRLELSIRQDLNTSPEIFAKDNKSEKERQLTDLNPTFRQIKFGKVEQFNWEDKSGKTINGGLVYPPDFESGKRYPLVIQTHGFNPNEFLIEGPYPGAFAAQAFAAKDIMVLQVPGLGDNPERRKALRSAVESAIDLLDERELINRNKVGLIGFSNTGHAVQHIITFSEYNFAAATIADAFSNSLMGYLGDFGYNMPEIERVNQGAVPWGERLAEWLNKDHTFHLDRVRTPLRLDEYMAMYVWWDVYAILRRLQKPVEWVVYPTGYHGLVKPLQRLAAQEGSVDWFTFWLKGEEDSDPEKVEQYKRWHKFRKQHEADLEKPRPALLNITTTPIDNPK